MQTQQTEAADGGAGIESDTIVLYRNRDGIARAAHLSADIYLDLGGVGVLGDVGQSLLHHTLKTYLDLAVRQPQIVIAAEAAKALRMVGIPIIDHQLDRGGQAQLIQHDRV